MMMMIEGEDREKGGQLFSLSLEMKEKRGIIDANEVRERERGKNN